MDHEAEAKPASAKRSGGGRRGDTRELGKVVRRYLGALEASRSSRGKRRTIEGFSARLLKIDELLVSADPLARLHLTQERIDLHAELVRVTNAQDPDLSGLEKEFVRVAKQYGELAGITFAAWRQVGVDAEVLDQAGIVRTGTPRPDASRVRRAAEVAAMTDGDAEPLLPRTDPIAPEPAPEPELVLELTQEPAIAPAPEPAPAPAPKPAPKAAKASTPPPPPRPKTPKPQKAAPKAAQAQATPAAGDGDAEAPKLRRKRIAD
jgi:hypothetical protein